MLNYSVKILSLLTTLLLAITLGLTPLVAQSNPESLPTSNPDSYPDSYPDDNGQVQKFIYTLTTGWNALNFPGNLVGITHTDGLYAKLQEDDVELDTIARFDAGRFDSVAFDNKGQSYGNHFNIIPGKGILINVLEPAEVEINIQTGTNASQELRSGWNFIGGTRESKGAVKTLQDYNSTGKKVVTISKLENNIFKTVTKQNNRIFGNDYPLRLLQAYFIKVES